MKPSLTDSARSDELPTDDNKTDSMYSTWSLGHSFSKWGLTMYLAIFAYGDNTTEKKTKSTGFLS